MQPDQGRWGLECFELAMLQVVMHCHVSACCCGCLSCRSNGIWPRHSCYLLLVCSQALRLHKRQRAAARDDCDRYTHRQQETHEVFRRLLQSLICHLLEEKQYGHGCAGQQHHNHQLQLLRIRRSHTCCCVVLCKVPGGLICAAVAVQVLGGYLQRKHTQ